MSILKFGKIFSVSVLKLSEQQMKLDSTENNRRMFTDIELFI